jgi:hypothetical protein
VGSVGPLTFLHPWLLGGLLACSLPVLIHLSGRRRAPTVYFAAFDFLQTLAQKTAFLERLRRLLILLLRILLLAALCLLVARPMPVLQATAPRGAQKIALLLDASASMGARSAAPGGALSAVTSLQRARKQAQALLGGLQSGDSVSLVVAGEQIFAPVPALSSHLDEVEAALAAVQPSLGRADLATGLERAVQTLGSDCAGAKVVVLSDRAQGSFAALRPLLPGASPEIVLLDANPDGGAVPANLAVEAVRVQRDGDSAAHRAFYVTVHNYGAVGVQRQPLDLRVDGQVVQRSYLDVAARSKNEKLLTHSFAAPGSYAVELRLAPLQGAQAPAVDGYAADDVYPLTVDISRAVRVLALEAEVGDAAAADALYFVERAFAALPRGDAPIFLQRTVQKTLEDSDAVLRGFDVVLLCNLSQLSGAALAAVERFVAAGGGVLVSLGPQTQFEQVNQSYGRLLPSRLRDLHLAQDPAAKTAAQGMEATDYHHPIFAGLGAPLQASLRACKTRQYHNLEGGAQVRSVLRFADGAQALVEKVGPGGRVMLLTTSLNLDYTDLPLQTAFVALMQRTVRYLGQAAESVGPFAAGVGESLEVPLPTGMQTLTLRTPSGGLLELSGTGTGVRAGPGASTLPLAVSETVQLRTPPLTEVGFYRAYAGAVALPAYTVAVHPSLVESDFLKVTPAEVQRRLAAPGGEPLRVSATAEAMVHAEPGFSGSLALLCAVLFVAECGACQTAWAELRRWRRRRGAQLKPGAQRSRAAGGAGS